MWLSEENLFVSGLTVCPHNAKVCYVSYARCPGKVGQLRTAGWFDISETSELKVGG